MSTVSPPAPAVKRRFRMGNEARSALVFLVPAGIGLVLFYLVPALRGLYYSFTSYEVLTPPEWVGLDNYQRLIDDPLFWNALKVTLYYVLLNIGFQTVLAIGIAVLMQRLTNSTFLRGVALMPYFIANVVVALVWYFMMDYQIGIVNVLFEAIGLD
ncbi:MAG: carbohydrate ABC transporter permease [Ancrocorticia populi]